MYLKVDLMKAYNSLNWDYILHCLNCLGALARYIAWIWACITSPSFTIALNGTLVGYFQGRKGLRQGDPLYPYLFVLAMKDLSLLLEEVAIRLNHLCFADELLVFFPTTIDSVTTIIRILAEFETISGLWANPSKSFIFLAGVSQELKVSILDLVSMLKGTLLVRYLGVPLITKRLTYVDCETLVAKITAHIDS